MGKLLNIGYANQINSDKIVAVVVPDSAPSKRLIQTARDNGHLIDATQGRRTRAMIVTESGHIVLSALMPETISNRYTQEMESISHKDSKANG